MCIPFHAVSTSAIFPTTMPIKTNSDPTLTQLSYRNPSCVVVCRGRLSSAKGCPLCTMSGGGAYLSRLPSCAECFQGYIYLELRAGHRMLPVSRQFHRLGFLSCQKLVVVLLAVQCLDLHLHRASNGLEQPAPMACAYMPRLTARLFRWSKFGLSLGGGKVQKSLST